MFNTWLWLLASGFILQCCNTSFRLSSWHMGFCRHCCRICYTLLRYPTTIISTFSAMMVNPHLTINILPRTSFFWVFFGFFFLAFLATDNLILSAPTNFYSCPGGTSLTLFVDTLVAVLPFLERTTFFLYPICVLVILFPICKYFTLFPELSL